MSDKLLPCPFCGSEAYSFEKEEWSRYGHVVCGGCEAVGPDAYAGLFDGEPGWKDEAVKEWNTRAANSQQVPPSVDNKGQDEAKADLDAFAEWCHENWTGNYSEQDIWEAACKYMRGEGKPE